MLGPDGHRVGEPLALSTSRNGDEYLSPTEIGKARDDLIKAAWTALQLFENRFFYG